MMMQSRKQIIGLSLLMSLLISISRCNDIINVGWVSLHVRKHPQLLSTKASSGANASDR